MECAHPPCLALQAAARTLQFADSALIIFGATCSSTAKCCYSPFPSFAGLAVTQAAALSVYAGTASPPSDLAPLSPSPSPSPVPDNTTQPASADGGMPIAEIAGIAGGAGGAVLLTGAAA